ncbi:hypothetical protein DC498_13235 [Terrimonas sp.]|uniref:DUF5009 domain-containing protein n=1 Tax=Terrimonas sp. TaxID=1914338 RepID=UPI000D523970|nr:DUF5009 domain-containing protein [Terrimonas sp.]PVD51683.1 hypothetical protein DC498_13235 [Terrimonas sp.]
MPSPSNRILSVDAFRGITILVMIFVNELAGISNIPAWMKHVAADADAMTFVDVVFPAFLFIVGMSIPFAMNRRLQKGDDFLQIQWHVIWRTFGLLILGVFMVNGEGGNLNEKATGMSRSLWLLLFYTCIILVWNVYAFKRRWWKYVFQLAGFIGLVILGLIYRGGEEGTEYLTPRWWGILGLIGWAYLYACILYQVSDAKKGYLIGCLIYCILFYMAGKTSYVAERPYLLWIKSQSGNAIHTAVVLCGIILSLIFFDKRSQFNIKSSYIQASIFTGLLFITGYFLRPYYTISKIYATPTWALYSAGISCVVFCFLYWLIDIKGIQKWANFFKPVATNPLLAYIMPGIIYALSGVLHITITPRSMQNGAAGIVWSLLFAVATIFIVKGLNRLKIKLQL